MASAPPPESQATVGSRSGSAGRGDVTPGRGRHRSAVRGAAFLRDGSHGGRRKTEERRRVRSVRIGRGEPLGRQEGRRRTRSESRELRNPGSPLPLTYYSYLTAKVQTSVAPYPDHLTVTSSGGSHLRVSHLPPHRHSRSHFNPSVSHSSRRMIVRVSSQQSHSHS